MNERIVMLMDDNPDDPDSNIFTMRMKSNAELTHYALKNRLVE